ncbi:recombinase family protein [Kribbella sp. NPDC004138]
MTTTELDRRPALSLDPDPLGVIGGGMQLGYARVSTREQNLHRQIDALTAAGCGRIWQEKLSGKNADRPELQECLAFALPNDVVVTELSRLGRNFQDLIQIVSGLRRQEIGFKSLHEALDTTTPGGRMIFHVLAALGEFIREMIVQGTREGLDAARAVPRLRGHRSMTTDARKFNDHRILPLVHDAESAASMLAVGRKVRVMSMSTPVGLRKPASAA